ncbi:MAG: cytochrome c [Gammaproteobacteria bacterium]
MRYFIPIIVFLTAFLSRSVVADVSIGKDLHDEHCLKCHGTEVYSRKDRFVKNPEGLDKQIKRCQLSVGAQWFDEEAADVADYLNSEYYHFEK